MKFKIKYTKTYNTCIEASDREEAKRRFHVKHPKGKIVSTTAYSVRESAKKQVIALAFGTTPMTQTEIAEKVGCSRTLVSQYINLFCAEHRIKRPKKDLMARDPGDDASTPQH